ncbi:MAG: PKD domain-containing protein [Bacteroidia bacterium]|nr:PKD domain-containing protein [Bacteroidia bacterium]
MKTTFVIAAAFCSSIFIGNAQQSSIRPCGTDENLSRQIAANPGLIDLLMKQSTVAKISGAQKGKSNQDAPYIIPVVFHVIHNGGSENISKAQILDQIANLNLDYMRLNSDTSATLEIFKPVAGVPNIQFRLANLDPNGNCTDGIVRVKSILTDNAGETVKALSYWPSNKYLNIWVVKSIADQSGSGGITLGYAQFPGAGAAETDGVVVRGDYVGSIGTASNTQNGGRTLTHEIGHILGLFHTFQGGCSGGFFGEDIDDTPPVAANNFGCNLSANSCTNDNPDLPDMVQNYMDYSNGTCMNLFSAGQCIKMQGILNNERANLVSPSNNVATGTDDAFVSECAPVAHFIANKNFICSGAQVKFTDNSFNGIIENRQWTFEGGNPASSTDSIVNVTYSSPGHYSVSLTVSNGFGNDVETITQMIYVLPDTNPFTQGNYVESFELPDAETPIIIENVENLGGTWGKAAYAYTGTKSIRCVNYNGANPDNAIDYFSLYPIDMTTLTNPVMTFWLAYAQKPGNFATAASEEKLRVMVSTNCGTTWTPRFSKQGATLATTQSTSSGFSPSTAAQWEQQTVNLSSYTSYDHLLIRFELTSNGGNNIYIDDINLGSGTGMEDLLNPSEWIISPNPSSGEVYLNYVLTKNEVLTISLNDLLGRTLLTIENGLLNPGEHQNTFNTSTLEKGIYLLNIETGVGRVTKKIIVE